MYIGRYHPLLGDRGFGNPYTVREHGREKAVALYHQFCATTITDEQRDILREATKLGCWCSGQCHGQSLTNMIDI